MKKKAMSASVLLASVALVALTACGGSDKNASTTAPAATASEGSAKALPNIRYVDGDSATAQYKGFRDLENEHVRQLQQLENARMAKANEIQRFGQSIEQKMQSNGYLSEQSYNADVQRLQKMQQDAESYMNNLARKADLELAQKQTALQDTIDKFIKEYNKTRGYDMILLKASGLYFNPALDITEEVVKGLNDGYTSKSEEKK